MSTSTLLPAKLTSWAGGDSAIPEASPVIFATYSLGQTNIHNLFCHNKKLLQIQYIDVGPFERLESGRARFAVAASRNKQRRRDQLKAKSSPASLVNHWLFSQHFDKQLKSSKISQLFTACRIVDRWLRFLNLHSPLLTWQQKIMKICSPIRKSG